MPVLELRPQVGPQEEYLACTADIAGIGGGAGGGKTYAILLEGLRHIDNPGFGAVIFRRTNEDIRNEGALWDTSLNVYSGLGTPKESTLVWGFKSGATISFKGLQYEKDVYNFQGSQICFMGFDELTHFSSKQFWYMISRNRSTCGVRPYVRFTLNPDPDSWVFELLAPWVDEKSPVYGAKPGELRWFIRQDDQLKWVPEGTTHAKSISFFPALVYDNKILMEQDPGYESNLRALSHEDQERLLHGKWSALEAKGALWSRANIDRDRIQLPDLPRLVRTVVGLDPSASDNPDSDEAGIVVAGIDISGHCYTLADYSGVMSPENWAKVAVWAYHRWDCSCIVAEKNNGGEMVRTTIHTVERVMVKLVHAKDNKEVRAQPVAAFSSMGKDHHVGKFPALEGQLTRWVPNTKMPSPDRLDAKVYAYLELDPTIAKPTGNLKNHRRSYV